MLSKIVIYDDQMVDAPFPKLSIMHERRTLQCKSAYVSDTIRSRG